ncbi:hypothetical protein, partial [Neglectibacter sp. X4]|uniref:hypothetical protein n=1 Tax=Neglectibacter sp. X4 TaxID=2305472 RepID=UPI001A9BDFD5
MTCFMRLSCVFRTNFLVALVKRCPVSYNIIINGKTREELTMIKAMEAAERDAALKVADLMAAAARTAP